MQRALHRRRGALTREDDSEDEDERALAECARLLGGLAADGDAPSAADRPGDRRQFEAEDDKPKVYAEDAADVLLALPPRLASSRAQLKLHTYDPRAAGGGYSETKIGGHALDHRRPFHEDWRRRLAGPVKTAVVGAVRMLGSALGPSASPRSSPAFDARDRDVLVYSSVKIAGHAMDHVPFLSRGQPSRPLWGYVPNLGWPSAAADAAAPPLPPGLGLPPPRAARMFELEPTALSSLYDCSRCLRLRQTPRVQLACGHGLCAACASSRALGHAELSAACFLECAHCGDLVAVAAVEFTNHVVRLPPPPARCLSELSAVSRSSRGADQPSPPPARSSSATRLGLAWRHGGVIAVLSFLAGRLYPSGKTLRSSAGGTWHGVRSTAGRAAARNETKGTPEGTPEGTEAEARRLLDDVAGIAARLAPSADEAAASGAARWAKRVQGLRPPSPLLKFSFVRTLGVGSFAEVMLVRSRRRGDLSVLKESDKLPEAVNEIRLLSRVRSPHVVRIHQYFIEEVGHRPFAYIEMEYCDGGDLLQRLRAKGAMPEDEFDAIFHQLCAGLQEIHARGIVHRDLKPGNVLLTSDGAAKIADFGVSTCLESELLTHHAAGTLAFMAPEVRRYFLGEDVSYDAKADVWSLGALAVAMLTGDPEPRVATRPLEDVVDDLRERGLSERSVELVERTLQRQPEQRPALADLLTDAGAAKARL